MENPLETHWCAVKRILCYLSGATSSGLTLVPANSAYKFSRRTYNGSDWTVIQMIEDLSHDHVFSLVLTLHL